MKTLGSVWLAAACIALLVAPSAQGHKLTVKRARAALSPVVAETAPQVAPKIAAKLPGATITKTAVPACEITKKGHRAVCIVVYRIAGGPTEDTQCIRQGRVEFRSRKSKKLTVSFPFPELECIFSVPLDI